MRRNPGMVFEAGAITGRLPVPDYVAFDLETTGLLPDDDEILEVALVRFASGKPVEKWSTLLNPGRSVPLKTLRLTHIDIGEIVKSPSFADIVGRIGEVSRGLPLVGHNSPFDTAFLARRIEGFPGVPVFDTLELARIAIPGFHSYKLTDLARELGVPLTDAHRAYDDAEVSGIIFAIIQERVLSMGPRVRESIVSMMGREWEPRRIFLFEPPVPSMLPLFEEPVVHAAPPRPTVAYEGPESAPPVCAVETAGRLVDLLRSGVSGNYSVNMPLLQDVARAVAEAANDYAVSRGERILLAGFPDSALPSNLRRAPVPEDFLCLRKFRFAMRLAEQGAYEDLDIEEKRFLASLAVWGEKTHTGSFSEIQVAGMGYGVAGEISCPRGMECKSSCPHARRCHYLLDEGRSTGPGAWAMRLDKAITATGAFDRVIVWGAHELHRVKQYSEERTDLGLLRESLDQEDLKGLVPAFARLRTLASEDVPTGLSSEETRKCAADVADQILLAAASFRLVLRGRFASESADQDQAVEHALADPPLVSRDLHRIERASDALAQFAFPSSGRLSLVEASYGDETRGPFLVTRSVWPARDAASEMRSKLGPVILLSDVASEAGVTEGGSRLLAIDAAPVTDLTLEAVPPASTDLLIASADVKIPATGAVFTDHAFGLLCDLARHVRRGLLALFPSRAQIREMYALLVPALEKEGIVVYAQGVDGGRKVVERLLEDNAIVLAVSTGMPGDNEPVPSCLVVVKVPFPPPNPLDEVRRKELSRMGADGFVEVNVRPSSLLVRAYAAKMIAAGGRRALVFGDPRLAPGRSKWAGEFFRAFSDLPRESGPVEHLVHRVSSHVSGNP